MWVPWLRCRSLSAALVSTRSTLQCQRELLPVCGSTRPFYRLAAFSSKPKFAVSVRTKETRRVFSPFVQCISRRSMSGARSGVLANDDIPFTFVRVVDDQGLVGDFSATEARSLARQRRTDLVVISGAVDPPLCRLVDLSDYYDELGMQEAQQEQRARERKLREFSFDPAMKVKGMRFSAVIDEHDLERKVNQVRQFLERGHRVEARVLQGRTPAEDAIDLSLRIIAEVRDISKPEFFEESLREFQAAYLAPKSAKRAGKAPPNELRIRLWPCSPEQAAAFQLPAHIVGPRRRRGPFIAGIDDENQPEDAWKYNRKPGTRKEGQTQRNWRPSESQDD